MLYKNFKVVSITSQNSEFDLKDISPVVEAEKRVLVGKIFVQAEFSYIASLYHVEPPKKIAINPTWGKRVMAPFVEGTPEI